ncbi:MAG: VWA domain-containing protein, partial [Acidimicrobiales bacterium]
SSGASNDEVQEAAIAAAEGDQAAGEAEAERSAPAEASIDELPCPATVAALVSQLQRGRPRVRFLAAAAIAVVVFASVLAAQMTRTPSTSIVMVQDEPAVVVLALDVSLSGQASDVQPSRLEAMKTASLRLIDRVLPAAKIGVVAFAGSAELVVAPTTDRSRLREGVIGLAPLPRTALGEAVFRSIEAIAAEAPPGQGPPRSRIILVSDGEPTVGRSVGEASQAALAAGVPVSTVALGTPSGVVTVEGRGLSVSVNPDPLRRLAEATKGRFGQASSLTELEDAYADALLVPTEREVPRDVGAAGVALAVAAALAAGSLALLIGIRRRRRGVESTAVVAADDEPATGGSQREGDDGPATVGEQERYMTTLIARGEGAREVDGELREGATQEIIEDEHGNTPVVRRRFEA